MKRPWKPGQIVDVVGAGARGTHGCTSSETIRVVSVAPADDGRCDWTVAGIVLDSTACGTCGADITPVGTRVVRSGWYDPLLYGHSGLQE